MLVSLVPCTKPWCYDRSGNACPVRQRPVVKPLRCTTCLHVATVTMTQQAAIACKATLIEPMFRLVCCCCTAVAKAGYVLPASKDQPAVQCTGSTYAPNYNRLRACLPCQSGLQVPPGYTEPHADKNDVCQVPPGKFWELNVVRDCPVGLYRSGFVRMDNRTAIACLSCPEGWTTAATGTTAVGLCSGEWLRVPDLPTPAASTSWPVAKGVFRMVTVLYAKAGLQLGHEYSLTAEKLLQLHCLTAADPYALKSEKLLSLPACAFPM